MCIFVAFWAISRPAEFLRFLRALGFSLREVEAQKNFGFA